ncbi:liver-expressed antimicrobial peptide 2-like [Limanda limanda]|uniref:liver-expressed antimicrobial peptide 2-like n=1 Tax=Limanda limanda TaxID=27771 RepID=UPI0029C7ACAA|nr:liver-expressed antimicrobial peptide 2-like [Limanda limanda]
MRTLHEKILVLTALLSLICAVQVSSIPLPEDWNGLIVRTKRSLLWRWNSMKAVGASCRDQHECVTQYCRNNICSFWISS